MPETITPAELQACLANQSPCRIIDVRRRADFEAEPVLVPGALWRNPDDVDGWAKELPETTGEIVVYCARGGSVSKSVVAALGGKNVSARYVEGGLAAWRNTGGALEGA